MKSTVKPYLERSEVQPLEYPATSTDGITVNLSFP